MFGKDVFLNLVLYCTKVIVVMTYLMYNERREGGKMREKRCVNVRIFYK